MLMEGMTPAAILSRFGSTLGSAIVPTRDQSAFDSAMQASQQHSSQQSATFRASGHAPALPHTSYVPGLKPAPRQRQQAFAAVMSSMASQLPPGALANVSGQPATTERFKPWIEAVCQRGRHPPPPVSVPVIPPAPLQRVRRERDGAPEEFVPRLDYRYEIRQPPLPQPPPLPPPPPPRPPTQTAPAMQIPLQLQMAAIARQLAASA